MVKLWTCDALLRARTSLVLRGNCLVNIARLTESKRGDGNDERTRPEVLLSTCGLVLDSHTFLFVTVMLTYYATRMQYNNGVGSTN